MSHLTQPVRSALSELLSSQQVGAEGIEVARGAVIHRQGNAADHVYFIHHGQVRLYQVGPDGEERLVEILGAGQWFGCSALTTNGKYTANAIAATQAQLSKVSGTRLMELVKELPKNQQEVVRLRFHNHHSYQEISDITGLSVGNVGFLLNAAMRNLRSKMERDEKDEKIIYLTKTAAAS